MKFVAKAQTPHGPRRPAHESTLGSECGQAVVLLALFVPMLIGVAALALDVGSWYRADRAAQATADSAALAGAQKLHSGTGDASVLAAEYATKNGGGDVEISFGTKVEPNDLITVTVSRPTPGIFSRLFGIDSVEVAGRATARAGIPAEARGVAPIAVNEQHPMLQCGCFGDPTQVVLINLHGPGSGNAAGAFGLVNLDSRQSSGNVGAGTLAGWVEKGYEGSLPLGAYNSAPSANFNNGQFKSALASRLGTELLFPVYRSITGPGSGAEYDIVAWVGFVPTSYTASGNNGTVRGYFTKVIWQGLADESGTAVDFGARVITLVE